MMFCHHAGTASPWFELLRRAASWTNVFGRFCTVETLLSETSDLSFPVVFEHDGFRVGLSPGTKVSSVAHCSGTETNSMSQSEIISVESCRLVDDQSKYQNILHSYCNNEEVLQNPGTASTPKNASRQWGSSLIGNWVPKRQKTQDFLTLRSKSLVVRVHHVDRPAVVHLQRWEGAAHHLLLAQRAHAHGHRDVGRARRHRLSGRCRRQHVATWTSAARKKLQVGQAAR